MIEYFSIDATSDIEQTEKINSFRSENYNFNKFLKLLYPFVL